MDTEAIFEKYLPEAQFRTKSKIHLEHPKEKVFNHLENLNFHDAKITSWLFRLRRINTPRNLKPEGLSRTKFKLLHSEENNSIVLGLIGKFWTYDGALQDFNNRDFIKLQPSNYAKAIWKFSIAEKERTSEVTIETRIRCYSAETLNKMNIYWTMAKPLSNFTRNELLNALKRNTNRADN